MTHQQIADLITKETGIPIARSTISAALSRAGLTQRVRYDEVIPWNPIKAIHNRHYALTMLRLEARRLASIPLTEEQEKRLAAWKEKLDSENAVVVYLPNTEDGFFYVKKKPSEKGKLIRFP